MNFIEFYESEQPLYHDTNIFVDMDGVLCDFASVITKALQKQVYAQITPRDIDEFFSEMNTAKFFERLPKFPQADLLIKFIIRKFGKYDICSRPLKFHPVESIVGKNLWIDENLQYKPKNRYYTFNKEEYAMTDGKPNILIDDLDENIFAWKAAGGIAIQYDASFNSVEEVVKRIEKALVKVE
jgi:phosphoglycolate phosphatase-like HAD superfamily hydrolase